MAVNLRPLDALLGSPLAPSGNARPDAAGFADALQQAKQRLQSASPATGTAPAAPGLSGDLAREQAEAKLAALDTVLRQRLPEWGLGSLDGVTLTRAPDGALSVGGTGAAEALAERIAQDPSLQQQVQDTAAAHAFVRAADESAAFQRAFAANPRVAVAQYGHLLSGERPQPAVSFRFGSDGASVQVG